MTVRELIEMLQKMPPDKQVYAEGVYDFEPVGGVDDVDGSAPNVIIRLA